MTKRSYGVYYTSDEIRHYLDVTFKDYTAKHPAPAGQSWVVGFYFMKKMDSVTNKRMDFLVYEALYDSAQHRVYDYFEEQDKYPGKHAGKLDDDDPTGYDAGHLWP